MHYNSTPFEKNMLVNRIFINIIQLLNSDMKQLYFFTSDETAVVEDLS